MCHQLCAGTFIHQTLKTFSEIFFQKKHFFQKKNFFGFKLEFFVLFFQKDKGAFFKNKNNIFNFFFQKHIFLSNKSFFQKKGFPNKKVLL